MMSGIISRTVKKIKEKMGGLYWKLTVPALLIVAATFLIISCICIIYYKSAYQEREVSNQRQQMDKVVYGLSTIQGTVENVSKQVAANGNIQDTIQKEKGSEIKSHAVSDNLRSTLSTYTFIMEYIQEVLIYTKDGQTISSSAFRNTFDPLTEKWYPEFKALAERKGYTNVHMATVTQGGKTGEVISYVMTFYSMTNYNQELGDIIISLDYASLEKMAEMDTSLLNGYAIYNERGEKVVGKGRTGMEYEDLKAAGTDRIVDGDGNIFLISDELSNGWIMVTEISGQLLHRQILLVEIMIVIAFLVVASLMLTVLFVNIRKVVRPINHLSLAAEQFGTGNFDVSVDVRTGDEVEILARAFNKMVKDVQRYTEMSVEHEKIIRMSQVDQLLLQINPHFIYNTLNSITYMARMEGNKEIERFVNAFISLLQNTLRVENKIYITLEEELKNVENYLVLQKYRYMDKFKEKIICPADLREYLVPKVILQPVVENAIFHGIAPMEGQGKLLIAVEKTEDRLRITVNDNGIGMTDDMIKRLFDEKYTVKNGMRRIGIANVSRRITDICGDGYGMHIESKVGVGTSVIMDLPLKTTEQEEDNG